MNVSAPNQETKIHLMPNISKIIRVQRSEHNIIPIIPPSLQQRSGLMIAKIVIKAVIQAVIRKALITISEDNPPNN